MKKTSFLHNLFLEDKLFIVEPNEIIFRSYFEKLSKTMISPKTVFAIGNYNNVVALTYYNIYYS